MIFVLGSDGSRSKEIVPSAVRRLVVADERTPSLGNSWGGAGSAFDVIYLDGAAESDAAGDLGGLLLSDDRTASAGLMLAAVLKFPELLDSYDLIWAPSERVSASRLQVELLFDDHSCGRFVVGQPSIARGSIFARSILLHHEGLAWRALSFVEAEAAIWSTHALRRSIAGSAGVAGYEDAELAWFNFLRGCGGVRGVYDSVPMHFSGHSRQDPLSLSDLPAEELEKREDGGSHVDDRSLVLRAGVAHGSELPLIDVNLHLDSSFPHGASSGQLGGWVESDTYRHRRQASLMQHAVTRLLVRQANHDADAGGSPSGRKNLVCMRVGEKSLHPDWFTPDREFDIIVDAHGDDPSIYDGTCDRVFDGLGRTGSIATYNLFMDNPEYLQQYDAFWFPDDDICTSTAQINALFRLHRELGYDLSQPALSMDSYYTFSFLVQHAGLAVREVNYVESMVPIFTREALAACIPTMAESDSAWGIDGAWASLIRALGGRMAIYDCLPVRHTRPAGLRGPQNGSKGEALAEMVAVMEKYGGTHLQFNEVTAAWDLNFERVPEDRLPHALLSGYPRTPRQRPIMHEPYLRLFLPRMAALVRDASLAS